jgi:hypothetical protein
MWCRIGVRGVHEFRPKTELRIIAPSIPPEGSNAAPKSMSDSWFIVEYVSLFFRLSWQKR